MPIFEVNSSNCTSNEVNVGTHGPGSTIVPAKRKKYDEKANFFQQMLHYKSMIVAVFMYLIQVNVFHFHIYNIQHNMRMSVF